MEEITKEEFDNLTNVVKSVLVDKNEGVKYFKESN